MSRDFDEDSEVDLSKLDPDETFVALQSNGDSHGFCFWIARITEPLTTAEESFIGVDGARFRKGDKHVCVQLLTRMPLDNPNVFTISEQVVYVHVHSLFHIGVKRSGSVGDQTILLDNDVLKTIHDALIVFMYGD